jgi:hypothetical protein
MQGGKKSLIVNSTNIRQGQHRAPVEMTGQNGAQHNFTSLVGPKCPKAKHRKKKKGGKR